MLNLAPFETSPLGRQERANTAVTTTATIVRANEASSSNTCFHGHLDLSLGISLSHGGSGCDATGCGGNKASYGGGGPKSSCSDKDVRCMTSVTTTANTLSSEGRDGHVGDLSVVDGWAAAFMPSPTSFMHPWSLAARQQKAAAEQDRTPPATYVPSDARAAVPLPSSSAVGWPPVHTSRRNIVTSMHVTKQGATVEVEYGPNSTIGGGAKNVAAPPTDSTVVATRPPPANMFAKVHMEGYAIGRKINLRAQGSYDSLSRVLTKMTTNFFCPADCSSANVSEDLTNSDKFVFLYEDFEGDRMLVGDVPWELFLASAKRLYIVRNPTSRNKGHGEWDKEDKTGEP